MCWANCASRVLTSKATTRPKGAILRFSAGTISMASSKATPSETAFRMSTKKWRATLCPFPSLTWTGRSLHSTW